MKNEKNPKKEKDELIADPLKIFFIITIVPFSISFLTSLPDLVFPLLRIFQYGRPQLHNDSQSQHRQ
jgi:hypothetical protein